MSKIIIEEGLSSYKKTGTGQYAQNIFHLLCKMGYDVEMKRKPFLEKIKNSTIKRILYILWLNLVFPFLVIFKKSDKIIFTNTITPIFKIPGKKYYPVLHDLWAYKAPDTVTFTQGLYTRIVIFSIKHTYEKIITVSDTVKTEIIDFFKCPTDDVKVVYNTFSFGEKPIVPQTEEEQKKILSKYNIEAKKYILSVATLNKRKNIPMLIDAYKKLKTDIKLVLVGSASSEKFGTIDNKNIIFTGYVEDDVLKVLYKNALVYVFPSVYEGFGIPIIDAQAFGVPVLCSDIAVFREIASNGAEFCTPDATGIAPKLKLLLDSEKKRSELISLGKENIKRFLTENILQQVKNVLCYPNQERDYFDKEN